MTIRDFSFVASDVGDILKSDIAWRQFHNKTVLIAGAAGMLPAYFVDTLSSLKEGYGISCKVLALVRNRKRALDRLAPALAKGDVQLIEMDVGDCEKLDVKIDMIIHGASPASPSHFLNKPMETIAANSSATERLLKLGRRNRVDAFLFMSSAEVYGISNAGSDGIIDENGYGPLDPVNPRSVYAESKRLGEALCAAARREWQLNTQIVRPFHTYGPGLRLDDGRIFAYLTDAAIRKLPLTLNGDGTAIRSFCYASDATEGFLRVMLGGDGKPYNIGNPNQAFTMRELAYRFSRLFPERTTFKPAPMAVSGEASIAIPSIARAGALGWSPKTTVEDGFSRTVRSYL